MRLKEDILSAMVMIVIDPLCPIDLDDDVPSHDDATSHPPERVPI